LTVIDVNFETQNGGFGRRFFFGIGPSISSGFLNQPTGDSQARVNRDQVQTGRVFVFSINTRLKIYRETTYTVFKIKAKARHLRGDGLHKVLTNYGLRIMVGLRPKSQTQTPNFRMRGVQH